GPGGTLSGTIASDGKVQIPASAVLLDELSGHFGTVATAMAPTSPSDFTGFVDPATATIWIEGDVTLAITSAEPYVQDCPLGPLHLTLFASGDSFDPATGQFPAIDGSFSTPALPVGADPIDPADDRCGGYDSLLNSFLGLPHSAPRDVFSVHG